MKYLTSEDLTDLIRILADFRDRHYENAAKNKAEGIKARNLAWARISERLLSAVSKEKKEMEKNND